MFPPSSSSFSSSSSSPSTLPTPMTSFSPTNSEEILAIIKKHGIKTSPDDPLPTSLLKLNLNSILPHLVQLTLMVSRKLVLFPCWMLSTLTLRLSGTLALCHFSPSLASLLRGSFLPGSTSTLTKTTSAVLVNLAIKIIIAVKPSF